MRQDPYVVLMLTPPTPVSRTQTHSCLLALESVQWPHQLRQSLARLHSRSRCEQAYTSVQWEGERVAPLMNIARSSQQSIGIGNHRLLTWPRRCLGAGAKHDLAVFRLTQLWFRLGPHNAEVNTRVAAALGGVPSHKFLPLAYQIASRLGPAGTPFQASNANDHCCAFGGRR